MRLLSEPNSPTNTAEIAPTTTPARMPSGTPPTTSATPGNTASPNSSSRGRNGRCVTNGSMTAVKTGASAIQVAATDALASLIAP